MRLKIFSDVLAREVSKLFTVRYCDHSGLVSFNDHSSVRGSTVIDEIIEFADTVAGKATWYQFPDED